MPNNLQGQFDLASGTEGTAVPGPIATFTDSTPGDTAAFFNATIDWGDGVTTSGVVSGASGSFTVDGTHTYADDGVYSAVATITRTTDNTQLVLQSGGVVIGFADNDVLSGQGKPTIVANPGDAINQVVATFTNPYLAPGTGDYFINIDWGDGTVTGGALTLGLDNVYTVTGSHTYATGGNFIITTFMNDDGGGDNAPTAFAQTAADIGFGGSEVFSSATETVAVGAGTTVAVFVDNANLPSTSYTATIDWGDGTTTPGAVSGSPGSYTVTSSTPHTYADEGTFTEVVTVTRTTDAAAIHMSGSVNVVDDDHVSASGTATITGNPGVALNNVTLATFTDSNHGTNDFVATVDWGDGTTTAGTVGGSGGSFSVTGSHTYAQNGQDSITVSIAGDFLDGFPIINTSTTTTALIGVAPVSASDISGTEGTAIPATQLATFTDSNGADTAADFTATIDWGDGTTSTGAVSGGSGSFTVSGGHTYADEGQDAVTTTLVRTSDHASATAVGTANVDEADVLSLTADNISGNAGSALTNVQVATFTDTFTSNSASDFSAVIDWGDGTQSAGTVGGSSGSFNVTGTHTYTVGGNETVTVTVADDGIFATASATGQSTASINLGGQVVLTSATEHVALANTTHVATFSDNNLTDTAASFTATIDWGDGVTTPGTVVGAAGSFTVEGGHTYADEDSDTATVTLTRTSDQSSATVSGVVTVGEHDSLTGTGTTLSVGANSPFSGTVATFSDTDTVTTVNDLAATIDWDDGTTTAGTVSGSNGSFIVTGSHTYTTPGQDFVKVTLADDVPGTATATATTTANIAARVLSGQMVLSSATEAIALANTTTVATFTDTDTSDMAGEFSASINWGDGVTTAGTVVGSNGSFTVQGGHTYGDEGSDPASVTLTHNPDHTSATASGSVAVGEDDVLAGQSLHIKPKAGVVFTGAVATFSDTDTLNTAGDFTATIDWGDGTTTSGTVAGSNGSFTVNGAHSYAHPGRENVTVTLRDDAPGTATATAVTKATVSSAGNNDFNADNTSDLLYQENVNSAHPNVMVVVGNSSAVIANTKGWPVVAQGDFSGDFKTDIVLQNTDGTPEIWVMNGTSVASKVDLTNPGSSWHIIAAADFNGDGKNDLLFQNNDGTPGVWLMNGTSVTSMTGLTNPGSAWHVIGAGDFDGDGNADILFQNTNGTPMIWEMNGSTVVSQATLTNPGSQWKAIGTGDFNGDGNSDILFQASDGTPGIWLMNGTSVVSMTGLTSQGSTWKVIGSSDFNGDGKSDIMWQRTDGTPGFWLMNGASIVSTGTFSNPGAQWQLEDDGPFDNAGGSAGTSHLSTPDVAVPATQTGVADPVALVPGTQNLAGAGLHLT